MLLSDHRAAPVAAFGDEYESLTQSDCPFVQRQSRLVVSVAARSGEWKSLTSRAGNNSDVGKGKGRVSVVRLRERACVRGSSKGKDVRLCWKGKDVHPLFVKVKGKGGRPWFFAFI